jgi:hypothetical protein
VNKKPIAQQQLHKMQGFSGIAKPQEKHKIKYKPSSHEALHLV